MDFGSLLRPWFEIVLDQVPGIELFDAHTHLGQNDPDGMKQSPQQLLETLSLAGARGAFVFPMHEPEGYPAANDFVIAAAASRAARSSPSAESIRTPTIRWPRRNAASRAAPAGSSSIRGLRTSPSIIRRSESSSRSPTSAGCRS